MKQMGPNHKEQWYSSLVWILSGVVLTIYGAIGLLNEKIPGIEELVRFLSSANGAYIYLAAFISMFLEGLYFFGSFFPGSTLVAVLAVLSQAGGIVSFLATIAIIFIAWCAAGAVNIFFATAYRAKLIKTAHEHPLEIKDRLWTTWFPAFRANYEVAQVIEGGAPLRVFLSSVRVKFLVSIFMLGITGALPLFIDIHEISNDEGFGTIAVVALITFTVGAVKMRSFVRMRKQEKQKEGGG